jgi:hypothetical protein
MRVRRLGVTDLLLLATLGPGRGGRPDGGDGGKTGGIYTGRRIRPPSGVPIDGCTARRRLWDVARWMGMGMATETETYADRWWCLPVFLGGGGELVIVMSEVNLWLWLSCCPPAQRVLLLVQYRRPAQTKLSPGFSFSSNLKA